MKKRIVSLLLALVMMLSFAGIAFAEEANDAVYLSVSYDGQFQTAADGSAMACVPVELSILKEIDLDTYGLGDYKYDADGDGNYEITALHLYIYAQEHLMGLKWSDVSASGMPGSMFFETGLFGFPDANLNYYYNGAYPIDEKMSADWGYSVGATADHIVLEAGDCLDVAGFSNDSWMIYSATFRYFTADDKVARHCSIPKGDTLTVKLGSIGRDWSTNEAVLNAESGAVVCYSQTPFAEDAATVTTDDSGNASITFDKAGKWYIWSEGYNDGSVSCTPAYAEVNVTWKNTSDVTSDWHNFRNSYHNMAVVSAATPNSAETTVLKWAVKLGTGWADNPSVQIIVDDALIVMSNKTLYKLDLQTGETLLTGTMSAAPNYGYTPASYADGLIFCPLSNGTVEAFDAETLESVWIYKDELGGQALSPILYNGGFVYTGFWNGETKDANYVCIDVSDGSLVWNRTVTGGFYWAGSVVIGDTLIVGSDDGESGAEGDSHLLSMNKKDGTVISDLTLAGCGDQRSSIAYNEANGRIYFSTKNGFLGSAAVNAETGEISDLKTVKQVESQSTSTPVVYGDKVFYTAGSGVVTGSGGSGNFIVADADTLEQLYAMPLLAYPQGSALVSDAYYEEEGLLYFYSTYNGQPGGLTLIRVDPSKDSAEGAEVIEIYDAKGYEQYCITSPICGPDGTIYYKNDSGYIMAVGTNNAYLSGLSASVGIQKGAFCASDTSMEWLVPIGTERITLIPSACEGGTVSVEGGDTLSLTDGTGTATIVVTRAGDSRTYTVTVREISADASLNLLKVNESNSFSGSALALTPEFDAGTFYYGVYNVGENRNFDNVWPIANDSNAAVKVYAIENVKNCESGDEIAVTGVNSGNNRYAIYFADDTNPMAIRIEVTAESGDVANYYLVLSKEAAAEAGAALLEQLRECKHANTELRGAKDATCTEAGHTGNTYCTDCQSLVAAGTVIKAAGHSYSDGICTVCGEADPDYKTAEGSVEVYVTLADKGNVVLFQQLITVIDVNHNGIFDVDDALYAAHEAGYEGGAAAGYSSYESQWGLSIGMLWGDTSYCYGYWLNNASCWSLEDMVADSDHLVAFVYSDSEYWSDAYSRFEAFDYSAEEDTALTVKLEKAGYDENWNTVFSAHAGATVTIYDADGKTVDAVITDNGDGTYTVTLDAAGSYYLVAADSDPLTVPAVCAVTVSAKVVEPSDPGESTDPADPSTPETGDSANMVRMTAVLIISLCGMFSLVVISRKRSF